MTIPIQDFLSQLRSQNIHLAVDGERLRVNAPKGMVTPALQEELSRRKSELIAWMRQPEKHAIKPAKREGDIPLSISQERLWKSIQMMPDNGRFNMYLAFRLNGELDVSALEQSLNEIVRRHETLRTAARVVNGSPAQRIMPFTPFSLPIENCNDDHSLLERLNELIRQPFDLALGNLHRFVLLKIDANAHVLALVLHHFIADGWSWDVLLRELSSLYAAYHTGQPSPLPPLVIQYADYAVWQREQLSGARLNELQNYWSAQLKPPLNPVALPNAGNTRESRRVSLPLEHDLISRAVAFAQKNGATKFILYLAAFHAALHARCGQGDLVICTPAACRTSTSVEPLIGYFNNLLPLRTNAAGATIRDFLKQVRCTLQDALEHQEMPFDAIAELPEVASVSLSRAVFSLQGDAGWTLSLDGLDVTRIELFNRLAVFDVFLTMAENNGSTTALLEYRAGVLEMEEARELLTAFESALRTIIAQPDQRLSEWIRHKGSSPSQLQSKPPEYCAPRTPAQKQLVALWEANFNRAPIGIHDDFFALGGTSLLAYRLFGRIARDMNANLPLSTLYQHTTIEKLATIIEQQPAHRAWTSLVAIQPCGTRPPFFGIHGQDGHVLFWRHIVKHLHDDQPFYGIQARGVDGYSKPLSHIEEMAELYLQEVQQVQPAGPYFLGGFSMGGEIAFEMAQRILAQGGKVHLLVMFDTGNPDRPVRAGFTAPAGNSAQSVTPAPVAERIDKFGAVQRKLINHARRLSAMKPSEQMHYITHDLRYRAERARLKAASAMYRRLGRRMPHSILQPYLSSTHMDAVLNYVPKPYAGRITLFRATATLAYSPMNSPMGWEPLALGGLDLHLFDATHRIVDEEYSKAVGKCLQMCLDAAQSR